MTLARSTALALVGCVLGALSMFAYENFIRSHPINVRAALSNQHDLATAACMLPSNAENDDIFFVSCGGIY